MHFRFTFRSQFQLWRICSFQKWDLSINSFVRCRIRAHTSINDFFLRTSRLCWKSAENEEYISLFVFSIFIHEILLTLQQHCVRFATIATSLHLQRWSVSIWWREERNVQHEKHIDRGWDHNTKIICSRIMTYWQIRRRIFRVSGVSSAKNKYPTPYLCIMFAIQYAFSIRSSLCYENSWINLESCFFFFGVAGAGWHHAICSLNENLNEMNFSFWE